MKKLILLLFVLTGFQAAWAQDVHQDQPRVGRDAAARYFQREPSQDSRIQGASDHYLALSLGRYMNSAAYEWGGKGREDDVGGNAFGLTYRVGEWYNSMDLAVRVEYQEFNAATEHPTKLSLMPLITFPDASSRFPLYFGVGAGLGVFFKQIEDESALSLDYQLIAGARFFNIFENTGFFVEAGLKNHLLLLSSGQLNGTFLALGAVFTF